MYSEGEADEARHLELDSIKEAHCTTLVQSARYQRYHDCNVRERLFSIGDLVLRRIQDKLGLHKLNSRWEELFIVKQTTRPRSYRLQYPEGQDVPNSYIIQNEQNFYHKKTPSDSCSSSAKAVSFRFNLEAMCYRIRNVNSLLKFGGYSHIQVSYKSTSCHKHDGGCDDDRIFQNRLDPLNWIQSNLFDGLTLGAILTTPKVAELG
jgi:hypothetical protein